MSSLLVTGSSGPDWLGSRRLLLRSGLGRSRHRQQPCAPTSSGRRATRAGTSAGLTALHKSFKHHEFDIRDREWRILAAETHQARSYRAHRRPTEPRPGRSPAVRRLRRQRRGARSISSKPCGRMRRDAVFVHMSTNKVYGDRPNTIRLKELADPLGLRRPRSTARHPEDFPIDQSKHSLFGASQGGRRRDGPGVWPVLRHEDLLPARRLSDGAESLAASSCTDF